MEEYFNTEDKRMLLPPTGNWVFQVRTKIRILKTQKDCKIQATVAQKSPYKLGIATPLSIDKCWSALFLSFTTRTRWFPTRSTILHKRKRPEKDLPINIGDSLFLWLIVSLRNLSYSNMLAKFSTFPNHTKQICHPIKNPSKREEPLKKHELQSGILQL